jgi:hypothetical protein
MNATKLVTVGTAVTLLTQVVKRAGGRRAKGPYVAPLLAVVCVGVWYLSLGEFAWPTVAWPVLSDWIAVTATAMGLYSATQPTAATAESTRLAIRQRVLADHAPGSPATTHMGEEIAR